MVALPQSVRRARTFIINGVVVRRRLSLHGKRSNRAHAGGGAPQRGDQSWICGRVGFFTGARAAGGEGDGVGAAAGGGIGAPGDGAVVAAAEAGAGADLMAGVSAGLSSALRGGLPSRVAKSGGRGRGSGVLGGAGGCEYMVDGGAPRSASIGLSDGSIMSGVIP
jgi:hypothetical protein